MPQTFTDVPCTVCGCVCDDLELTVSDGRVTHAERACKLAQPWFASLADPTARPAAIVDGQPVSLDRAVARAAEIFKHSRAPLIWGLSRSSTDGQRAAVLLAEKVGAVIDTTASVCHGPSIMAIQQVGESTCSLGEVRNRADLVIFWGADPANSHPRHFERYSADAHGMLVPHGRQDRQIIVIDSELTDTARLADTYVPLQRDTDFELIWALRQILRGIELPESFDIGLPPKVQYRLADQMKSCRYGAVFFGLGLAQRSIGHKNVEALLKLVDDLNDHTRFTARRLRIPGDVTGADAVLCWLTGFPFGVSLSRGYPRYNPGEYTANEILECSEADACLLVGSEPFNDLSPRAQQTLQNIPTIALDYPNVTSPFCAAVQFTTAIYGIHAPGTAYRMDEIPIPLRQLTASDLPTDEHVISAIADAIQ
jgi:formylmethanofuran dehydrogenase subunit B